MDGRIEKKMTSFVVYEMIDDLLKCRCLLVSLLALSISFHSIREAQPKELMKPGESGETPSFGQH